MKKFFFRILPALIVLSILSAGELYASYIKNTHLVPPPQSSRSTPHTEVPVPESPELHTLITQDSTPIHPETRKQFVVFAFDGSRSLSMWQATRDFAKEMQQAGKPLHFTYFINAVYLLENKNHSIFQAPHEARGISNIGFGTTEDDVLQRIAQINGAVTEGHEIGSHNTGHFEGSKWTYDEWKDQLGLFSRIVFHANELNPKYDLHLKEGDIVGFRAPDLGVNNATYDALKDAGYTYDASVVAYGNTWPKKLSNGMWEFPLGTVRVNPKHRSVLGMDYSLYVHQTGGKDLVKKGSDSWNEIYKNTYDAYMEYFKKSYNGNHAPIYMANHFSLWNDGVYFEVLKNFAREVCGKPDVVCGSYRDLMDYMNSLN